MDEEGEDFVAIDHLETLGINRGTHARAEVHTCTTVRPGDIKKAKDAGYYTCQSLLMNTKRVWWVLIACAVSMYHWLTTRRS